MIEPKIIEDVKNDEVLFIVRSKMSDFFGDKATETYYLEMKRPNIKFSRLLFLMSQMYELVELREQKKSEQDMPATGKVKK